MRTGHRVRQTGLKGRRQQRDLKQCEEAAGSGKSALKLKVRLSIAWTRGFKLGFRRRCKMKEERYVRRCWSSELTLWAHDNVGGCGFDRVQMRVESETIFC